MPRNWGIDTSSRPLILKRASTSHPSGTWSVDDYDVLAGGDIVGRIVKPDHAPEVTPWFWSLGYGHHEDCTPTQGYAATREDAMVAFSKSWRRR